MLADILRQNRGLAEGRRFAGCRRGRAVLYGLKIAAEFFQRPGPAITLVRRKDLQEGQGGAVIRAVEIPKVGGDIGIVRHFSKEAGDLHIGILTGPQPTKELQDRRLAEEYGCIGLLRRTYTGWLARQIVTVQGFGSGRGEGRLGGP